MPTTRMTQIHYNNTENHPRAFRRKSKTHYNAKFSEWHKIAFIGSV